jgi:ankyrin repeat protein
MILSAALARAQTLAIHVAAKAGDAQKVQALLDADPALAGARDGSGRTPLIVAAYWSHAEPQESSPYLAGIGEYGEKLQAQYMMPVEVAKRLIAAKADVGARDDDDYTALHWAALRGNKALAALLMESGAEVNATDKTYLATPLHLAVRAGHAAAVEALLAGNADIKAKDKYGRTPLAYAETSGREDIIKMLRRQAGRK